MEGRIFKCFPFFFYTMTYLLGLNSRPAFVFCFVFFFILFIVVKNFKSLLVGLEMTPGLVSSTPVHYL